LSLQQFEEHSMRAAYRELVTERANRIVNKEVNSLRRIACQCPEVLARECELRNFAESSEA
jgi:hypothetical protein